METMYSVHLNNDDEKKMMLYLMNDFCHDSYEREEMLKWIKQKNIEYVYQTVTQLFSKNK